MRYRLELDAKQKGLDDDNPLGAAIAKLEGYAVRFALITHLVASLDPLEHVDDQTTINEINMESGIALSRWHLNEASRIYADFSSQDAIKRRPDDLTLKLFAYVNRHGKTSYPFSDIYRALSLSAEAAKNLIDAQVAAGRACWEMKPGKRGSVRYVSFIPGPQLCAAGNDAEEAIG